MRSAARVRARSIGVVPIIGGLGCSSSKYSMIASDSAGGEPSSSSSTRQPAERILLQEFRRAVLSAEDVDRFEPDIDAFLGEKDAQLLRVRSADEIVDLHASLLALKDVRSTLRSCPGRVNQASRRIVSPRARRNPRHVRSAGGGRGAWRRRFRGLPQARDHGPYRQVIRRAPRPVRVVDLQGDQRRARLHPDAVEREEREVGRERAHAGGAAEVTMQPPQRPAGRAPFIEIAEQDRAVRRRDLSSACSRRRTWILAFVETEAEMRSDDAHARAVHVEIDVERATALVARHAQIDAAHRQHLMAGQQAIAVLAARGP